MHGLIWGVSILLVCVSIFVLVPSCFACACSIMRLEIKHCDDNSLLFGISFTIWGLLWFQVNFRAIFFPKMSTSLIFWLVPHWICKLLWVPSKFWRYYFLMITFIYFCAIHCNISFFISGFTNFEFLPFIVSCVNDILVLLFFFFPPKSRPSIHWSYASFFSLRYAYLLFSLN